MHFYVIQIFKIINSIMFQILIYQFKHDIILISSNQYSL